MIGRTLQLDKHAPQPWLLFRRKDAPGRVLLGHLRAGKVAGSTIEQAGRQAELDRCLTPDTGAEGRAALLLPCVSFAKVQGSAIVCTSYQGVEHRS
jgi:hypothetical protein